MKNWKRNFTGQVLSRGSDYYEDNLVRIKSISAKRVEAQVSGSREYNVVINFNNSNISSMFCDCPYFESCDYCKHQAATLYFIENHMDLIKPVEYSDLLNSFTRSELIEFLDDELKDNPELVNKLKLYKNDDVDEEYYINRLEIALNNTQDILKFMDNEIQNLIKSNNFTLMFKLLTIIIDSINENSQFGYMPSFELVIYKIDEVVSKVRNTASIDEISDFLIYAINSSSNYLIEDELTDCLSRNGDIDRLFDTWEKI